MTPREEALSLKENPLPDVLEDKLLPTCVRTIENRIHELEKQRMDLDTEISNLYDDHARMLDRAVKLGILEDEKFKIVEVVKYGNRICDPLKLKESNPETWEVYKKARIEKAERDASESIKKVKEGLDTKILLGLADEIFGKKNVDLCSQTPAMIGYEVKRK